MKAKILLIPLFIIHVLLFSSLYVVDETEQVVITQFGKAIGSPRVDPGLYFKIPFVQQPNYFPKTLLQWDGDPGQRAARYSSTISVDTFARWKVTDPLLFFQTVSDVSGALARLDDIIDAGVRNFIAKYPLIETVRWTNREMDAEDADSEQLSEKREVPKISMGRQMITQGILEQADPKLKELGIELIDVKIKRLNYVEEVRRSVYSRMIAERRQIAEKFRSEGEGEARKIEGSQERDLKGITSEAYKIAQKIKGKSDAESTLIYADAYNKDPDFYSFLKTLDVYN